MLPNAREPQGNRPRASPRPQAISSAPRRTRPRRRLSPLVGLSLLGHLLVFGLMAALSGTRRQPPTPDKVIRASLARLGSVNARTERGGAPARGTADGTPDTVDTEEAPRPAKAAKAETELEPAPAKSTDKADDKAETKPSREAKEERRKPRASDEADANEMDDSRPALPLRDDDRHRKDEPSEKPKLSSAELAAEKARERKAALDGFSSTTSEQKAEQRARAIAEATAAASSASSHAGGSSAAHEAGGSRGGSHAETAPGRAQGRPEAPKGKASGDGEHGSGAAQGLPSGAPGGDARGYLSLMTLELKKVWELPISMSPKDAAKFATQVFVRLGRDGRLLEFRIVRSSGDEKFDAAVEKAFRRVRFDPPTQPFLDQFGDGLEFKFRP